MKEEKMGVVKLGSQEAIPKYGSGRVRSPCVRAPVTPGATVQILFWGGNKKNAIVIANLGLT